jgi:hypothetical protein
MHDLAILGRTRERAERILSQNASNSAKALAKDALELCAIIEDFRAELPSNRKLRRVMRFGSGLGGQLDHGPRQGG